MLKKAGITKDKAVRIVTVILIASVFLLTVSILTDRPDSRKQISDDNGATEVALSRFLSGVKGVGTVEVMMQYNDQSAVSGVIITAEGAADPVVRNSITKGVATLFGIPASSVMVFEKNQEERGQ